MTTLPQIRKTFDLKAVSSGVSGLLDEAAANFEGSTEKMAQAADNLTTIIHSVATHLAAISEGNNQPSPLSVFGNAAAICDQIEKTQSLSDELLTIIRRKLGYQIAFKEICETSTAATTTTAAPILEAS